MAAPACLCIIQALEMSLAGIEELREMVRIQVHFEEDDLKELRRLSTEEGIALSEIIRRLVKIGLESTRRPSRSELMKRALTVVGKYHSGKHDVAQRHDDYLAEAYME